jgi:inactivated superfamily I helicase
MADNLRVARYRLSKKTGAPLVVPPRVTMSPLGAFNLQKAQQAAMEAALVTPRFTGTERISVNGVRWGVPPKSETITRGGVMWIRTPSGEFHILTTRDGQVREFVDDAMMAALTPKLEALFKRKRRTSTESPMRL